MGCDESTNKGAQASSQNVKVEIKDLMKNPPKADPHPPTPQQSKQADIKPTPKPIETPAQQAVAEKVVPPKPPAPVEQPVQQSASQDQGSSNDEQQASQMASEEEPPQRVPDLEAATVQLKPSTPKEAIKEVVLKATPPAQPAPVPEKVVIPEVAVEVVQPKTVVETELARKLSSSLKASQDSDEEEPAEDGKQSEEQVVPRADSLIEYQEVLESTPEDVAQVDIAAPAQVRADNSNSDEQQKHFDVEEIKQEQISTSSAEPFVADERIPITSNEEMEDISMEDDGNCDVHEMDEQNPQIEQPLFAYANQEQEHTDLNTEVKIEVSSIRPSMMNSNNMVVSQEGTTEFVTGESIETVIHTGAAQSSVFDRTSGISIIEVVDEPVSQELVNDELFKQGLGQVVRASDSDDGINTDYFLRLVNCQTQVQQRCQKAYIDQAMSKRRTLYQQGNWAEYAQIIQEMGEQQQSKHEEVLREVCKALGVSETDFTQTYNSISEGEHSEELQLAIQGQLYDFEAQNDDDDAQPLPDFTESVTLQIFETITRKNIEIANLTQRAGEGDDIQQVIVLNAKMIDQIYLDYGIELKQFQAVVHKLMSEDESFEQRLRDKEAEIVDDSV